jgi:hypothetical protein
MSALPAASPGCVSLHARCFEDSYLIGDVQNISRFQRWNWSDWRNGRARAALPQARVQQIPGGETTEPEESPR